MVIAMVSPTHPLPAEPAAHAAIELIRSGAMVPQRCHGSLESITDSERRALRPIGMTAHEVAVLTGALLTELFSVPGICIFQGVRSASADMPRIPHVISAGRRIVLVESVAWPPGQYAVTAGGRICCDGAYIGQSMHPLVNAVRHWREILPPGHRVKGLVVVHPAVGGCPGLPGAGTRDIVWTPADGAVDEIRTHLPRGREMPSISAVAALIAATAEEENR
jgi:hypothetical protein